MPNKASTPSAKYPASVRKEENGNYTVTLVQGCFSEESLNLASSGFFLDVLALSAKCWEHNECWENNIDSFDSGHQYILDQFDFEGAYIEALNNGKASMSMKPIERQAMFDSPLKNGAYCAIHHPENFEAGLKVFEEELRTASYECTGDYSTTCKELNDELLKAYDSDQSDMYNEWLNGDYRGNNAGILKEAEKYHGFESVDFTEGFRDPKGKEAELRIEVTEAWILDALGYADDYEVKKADAFDQVVLTIQYGAKKYVESERARRMIQKTESERVRAYQKENKEQNERARIDRLQAMKK